MKSRRVLLSGASVLILATVLFNFQNCAPTNKAGLISGSSSTVHVIEDLNQAQIQFVAPSIQLIDTAMTATLDGFCSNEHNGAGLVFTIVDPHQAATPIVSGASTCSGGQFALPVDQTAQLNCGTYYYVTVQGDWGASAFSYVMKRCAPQASADMAPPADSPYGTICRLEYSSGSCTEDCYRDDKLLSTINMDVSQCSALGTSVAGQ